MDAQADLGICCSLMPEDRFLHGTAHRKVGVIERLHRQENNTLGTQKNWAQLFKANDIVSQ